MGDLSNPLSTKFLRPEDVMSFFGKSRRWLRKRINAGRLTPYYYTHTQYFLLACEVDQAILTGSLVDVKEPKNDPKENSRRRYNILPSESKSKRRTSLRELRNQELGGEVGELG